MMDRKSSVNPLAQSRKASEVSIIEELSQGQKPLPKGIGRLSVFKDTALSSEKRRYSVQNASGSGALPPRNSPRVTPYVNTPVTSAGPIPVSSTIPRASIACIPMSVQAQIQQSQAIKSEQPPIAKPTSSPLTKNFVTPQVTPRASISKVSESDKDHTKKLGRLPKSFQCDCCQHVTVTRITYHVGVLTWLMAVLIFLCGGVLGCFLIPFFTNCCKDVKHECPFCGTEIGMVKCI
ncbi:unnamed protein product [Schistosoma spindalis]|nr:unnamed protein product [Schistosoma spindale]